MKLYAGFSCDMNPAWMEQFGRNVSYVGRTFIEGYRLRFRGDSPGSAKATLEEEQGAMAPCVLWMVNFKGEEALATEFGADYEKVTLPISYCGFSTKAKAFLLRSGMPLNRPGAEIVTVIRAAYKLQDISERLLDQAVQSSSI